MKVEFGEKFPCGYEQVFKFHGWGYRIKAGEGIFDGKCPLHGKKCSQSKSKANKK